MYTRYATSIAANGVNANVLASKQINMIVERSVVRIGAITPTAGVNMTVQCGRRIIVNDEPLPVKAAGDPIEPDDFHFQFRAYPGEYLNISFRNTTAGAIVPIAIIKTIP